MGSFIYNWVLDQVELPRSQSDSWSFRWPNAMSHSFLQAKSYRDAERMHRLLKALPYGVFIPCRGRNHVYDEWDYGYCTKTKHRSIEDSLSFWYQSGDTESLPTRGIDFRKLVHLAVRYETNSSTDIHATCQQIRPVVLVAHGWSPAVGPHYPLIQNLEHHARMLGCQVVVPDFRPTYKFANDRSRAERIQLIYEELLLAISETEHERVTGGRISNIPIILVGHSQGGAAIARACTSKITSALNIRGILMVAPEDPMVHDGMDWTPSVPHLNIIHPRDDKTIGLQYITRLSREWQCDLQLLSSCLIPVGMEFNDDGDDLHHDFLAHDLMEGATTGFDAFFKNCVA